MSSLQCYEKTDATSFTSTLAVRPISLNQQLEWMNAVVLNMQRSPSKSQSGSGGPQPQIAQETTLMSGESIG